MGTTKIHNQIHNQLAGKLAEAPGAACPMAVRRESEAQWLQSVTYVPAPVQVAESEAHREARRVRGGSVVGGFDFGTTRMARGGRGIRPWRERT